MHYIIKSVLRLLTVLYTEFVDKTRPGQSLLKTTISKALDPVSSVKGCDSCAFAVVDCIIIIRPNFWGLKEASLPFQPCCILTSCNSCERFNTAAIMIKAFQAEGL